MKLQAAIRGDLQALLKAELRGAERAVTAGVRAATLGLKAELRAQVTGAGMGTRLANTRSESRASMSALPRPSKNCRPEEAGAWAASL